MSHYLRRVGSAMHVRATTGLDPQPLSESELSAFKQAVYFAGNAIEEAACLKAPSKNVTLIDEHGVLVSLSYDDWFRMRGLLMCARYGPCNEPIPPLFNWSVWRHWEAWQACGRLSQSDACRLFCACVYALPGYRQASRSAIHACLLPCLPCLPCLPALPAPDGTISFSYWLPIHHRLQSPANVPVAAASSWLHALPPATSSAHSADDGRRNADPAMPPAQQASSSTGGGTDGGDKAVGPLTVVGAASAAVASGAVDAVGAASVAVASGAVDAAAGAVNAINAAGGAIWEAAFAPSSASPLATPLPGHVASDAPAAPAASLPLAKAPAPARAMRDCTGRGAVSHQSVQGLRRPSAVSRRSGLPA